MSYSLIRLSALPAAPDVVPKAMYFIRTNVAGPVEIFVSDANGVLHPCFDDEKVALAIETNTRAFGEMLVVPDIAARDALVHLRNAIVLVEQAQDDPEAGYGSAFYFYMKITDRYVLIRTGAGGGTGDMRWSSLIGGPVASPQAIDAAVLRSHDHANEALLRALDEANGRLTFNGEDISTVNFDQTPHW